uniref:Uncharacterized protein n=1 Tax=Arundo donax TaxID=35708 RepID=A0A0A9F8T7_ARUDO
MEEQPGCS